MGGIGSLGLRLGSLVGLLLLRRRRLDGMVLLGKGLLVVCAGLVGGCGRGFGIPMSGSIFPLSHSQFSIHLSKGMQ